MTKRLTPQNATITTASVEVRALTISGKQVTLSLFRQLEEETILHPLRATLVGEAWGRVNYHPDKCADDAQHLHVVWQKGSELRRARVEEPTAAAYRHLHAGLYVEALIADGLRAQTPHKATSNPNPVRIVSNSPHGVHGFTRFTHRGVQFHGPVRGAFIQAYKGGSPEGLWPLVRNVAGPEATTESIADLLPAYAYLTSWRQLRELPQLFIAT